MDRITLPRPDDAHVHLRDGAMLAAVLADTAREFARAVVMPNLRPPILTTAQALEYRQRILAALPVGADFTPLMTLYMTEATPPAEIARAAASGAVVGVKLYPAGATTHSDAGVRNIEAVYPVLDAMQRADLPLLVHGEVTDPGVDVYDREAVFIERVLAPLVERFAGLRVVLEHVTTAQGVEFVRGARAGVAATVTAHHLLYSRNALFDGGLRPHHYCLPVLKRERHRQALIAAATGADERFFLGTDSAPHPRADKESACGCAGIYTAHNALGLYAEAFEAAGALHRLGDFAARRAARFYRLAVNAGTVTLERDTAQVPARIALGPEDTVIPLRAGATVAWRVATD